MSFAVAQVKVLAAAGAGAVVHHHGNAEAILQHLRLEPPGDVAGAARRVGHDEPDLPVGPRGLGEGRHGQRHGKPGQEVAAADHRCLPNTVRMANVRSKKDSRAARKPFPAPAPHATTAAMDYRPLGRSGLKVSPLCLGTMMFGGPTAEPDAGRILGHAREAGINLVDTANAYNEGRSEEVLGRLIARDRGWWVVATKLANPVGAGPNDRGLSRRHCFDAVEASLTRLGIETIDILYLHKEDHATPLAETVRAIADLIGQGKVLHFGVSNFRSWRIAEICRLCDEMGVDRPVVSQPLYNALNRQAETEHLPACGFYGLGVAPYSPLARGVLTGKYATQAPPEPETRAGRADKRMMETEFRPESLKIAQVIAEHARGRGLTPGQFAIAWLLNNALVTSPIAGPRTLEQWREYLGALEYRFTAEDEALVDGLVAAGHPSTPGYNDPQYPIEGRPIRG
ncbi:aldo/keto reductase [Leptolyngbya sp. 15MV]|nr:aldo/keto reductase [Leptolyngbya sp. 15MV]